MIEPQITGRTDSALVYASSHPVEAFLLAVIVTLVIVLIIRHFDLEKELSE